MSRLHNRREAGAIFLGAAGGAVLAGTSAAALAAAVSGPPRSVQVGARPEPLGIDLRRTAFLVIDMQNDFVSKGGFLDSVGVDFAQIRAVVPNIAKALATARAATLPIVYVNMNYRPDLGDAGRVGGPNRLKQGYLGNPMTAPDGSRGAVLVRDTWNTQVVSELRPLTGDLVVYKTRYSGFANTELHAKLQARGIRNLVVTGCTTSVCVESTVRDAMFLDYNCVLLEDCMAEPQGPNNHEATLHILSRNFAWISDSAKFASALE